jgi:predicted dehydrogenase
MSEPVHVGIVGCGAISGAYLRTCREFPQLRMVACADINHVAAEKKAAEFGVERVLDVQHLLDDPDIDIVLNLTIPKAHAGITMAALNVGKHVYTEKPLGVTRREGFEILHKAKRRGLMVGGAPDTFMGSGMQTARKAIDDGLIGKPVAFTAFMMCPGHESWHANPEFFYEAGGGPMLDMGPYYVTALLNFFGPVKRISGMASIAVPKRTITSQPKFGKEIKVDTPDHICGLMEFKNGVIGTIVTSFATRFPQHDGNAPITIYGTEGTLLVPDPNKFEGSVKLRRKDDGEFAELPPVFARTYERGIGLLDMAQAIRGRRKMRAGLEQIWSTLDIMLGFLDSSKTGRAYIPKMKYVRPALMPIEGLL